MSREGEEYYKDPYRVCRLIAQALRRQRQEGLVEVPVLPMFGLIEVLHVEVYSKYRIDVLRIWAKAVRADGRIDTLEYGRKEVASSPQDGDQGYDDAFARWQNIDDQGKPIEWSHLYTSDIVTMDGRATLSPNNTRCRAKLKYLYHALAPQVRVRVSDHTLEINQAQREEGMRLLGKVMFSLSEQNEVWNTPPNRNGETYHLFPARGH